MYLKSIEIQGFKSFANKTVLSFNQGLTGIVGPNGSGKSNVADAVRWVLGEQKVKQLRGASMQDVIFSGTELRKPQGFAFVAITLDNSDGILPVDFREVTVSRRLYRSGESEYMLNGQQVRLRDVQELFYDTGIGKEGYSIIGQGQVESILNGRPEDRRGIFDEACGIVKFKRRKQLAEHKLETERANLVRVSDILKELESRIEPLKKQAESADRFLRLRDLVRKLDINLFLRELDIRQKELDKQTNNIEILKASLEDTRLEDSRLREGSEKLDQELSQLEKELEESKSSIMDKKLTSENIRSRIEMLSSESRLEENRLRLYDERIEKLASELDEKKASVISQLSSLLELRKELQLIDDTEMPGDDLERLMELTGRAESYLRELEHALSLEEGVLSEELADTSDASTSNALSEGSGQDHAKSSSSQSAGEPAEDQEEGFVEPDWLKAIKQKRSSLGGVDDRENELTAWLHKAEEDYNSQTLHIKELNRKINDCQQDYHTTATKLDSLKNLAERYEGYGQSIRAVMQKRSAFPGVRGVVADLIHTEAGYEIAVETALSGNIQNIVTDTEQTARNVIDYLKRNKLGRATFLPLDAIRGREKGEYERALSETGIIGLASDIVSYEREYKELVSYLLGRTLVAKDMDSALFVARRYGYRLRIVTLSGELLMPGGSISGGAYKNTSNLLGRSREIGELKRISEDILKKIDGLNEELVKAEKEAQQSSADIDELREELSQLSLEKNRLSLEIISEFRLKLSGLSQKAGFVTENIERLIAEIHRSQEEMDGLYNDKREVNASIGQKKQESELLQERGRLVSQEIETFEKELLKLASRREELSASQSEFFRKKDELSSELLGLEKELMRLEAAREKVQLSIEERTGYIWDEYELGPASAEAFMDVSLGSAEDIAPQLDSAKKEMRGLGPVNVAAIDEYKEVSERYEFLKAQHDDLVESEAAILSVIDELEKGMKKQFSERFADIRREFDKVFKELFGGGKGDLELQPAEDGDELSAGIIINAQPPGKKLQNMMQLSGGEKALTAIALLFAIQNLKPSPFCLLDEIEAALDDSNIDRFAAYLNRLSSRTQFIVITHRRGTMEACDRLYGITMQEKGVTALVSVDLVTDSLS